MNFKDLHYPAVLSAAFMGLGLVLGVVARVTADPILLGIGGLAALSGVGWAVLAVGSRE